MRRTIDQTWIYIRYTTAYPYGYGYGYAYGYGWGPGSAAASLSLRTVIMAGRSPSRQSLLRSLYLLITFLRASPIHIAP